MKSAAIAAALSATFSLPRMLLWTDRKFPLWYLEAVILFGGFVLWAFVFAWHTEYTRRPVFTLKIKPPIFALTTAAGILTALSFHYLADPSLRLQRPQDFPSDFPHLFASALFSLAFMQLFLLFAPFAWTVRLFRNERVAAWLTVAFGVFVLMLGTASSPAPLPLWFFAELLVLRILGNFLGIWFYLRGGILLVWWLYLLIEARHLLTLYGL